MSIVRLNESHHPMTTNRPAGVAESENYQQMNFQKFQAHIQAVVDAQTDEIRLTHLQSISEQIETISTSPNYTNSIELLVKHFLRYLVDTEPVFLLPSNAQTIRKQMIEIFHRLPINDLLRSHAKDILGPMFKLLTRENEENALSLLRIVVEYMKTFRLQMINEVRDFLQFVHNVYRQKSSALDQMFLTKKFSFPTSTIHDIAVLDLVDQICSSVQLTVKKIQAAAPITTETSSSSPTQADVEMFTIMPRASHSVKLLAEFPVAIVLLYQLCRQHLQSEFGDLILLFLKYLAMPINKDQKSDPKFNIDVYVEFLTTQAKTLSFLAFVSKYHQDLLTSHSESLVTALLQLLEGCPPENVQLRKDILIAARHFLSSDFRTFFTPHVRRFFDENLLLSTGYTARETLRVLAYNTFGEFFNHVRVHLSIEDLQSVMYMYSKMIHDSSLPPTIQVMSLKFLSNISESIRLKSAEKSRDLLFRIVEILVFKCKSLAKQCAHLLNNTVDKNSSTIPTIAEVDINTCTLNDLVQNLNDISNREKEIQRQQFALVRFQATSPLVFTLSAGDGRTLLKILLISLRHITWMIADVKNLTENLPASTKQFPPTLTILYIKFFKYTLQCLMLLFDSTPSTSNNVNASRTKEEKEIMDMIASVFIVMQKQNYREIFQTNLPYFYACALKNPNITTIINTLLQQSPSSTILVESLLEFLLPRIHEIGESNNSNNACLKLFKLVINSVVSINSASENEKILQPYLKQIILRSIECAQSATDPYNYFILLRALFRSIGVGNHDLLNQEFLTLLHFLLQRLNEYQSCHHRQHLRELFIELCLTVPVRLSVLLPYLPLLMEPLVNALNGSSTLILQGLRTLELCVDNLQPDFLYNHILPVRSSLMMSLYRLLSHSNNDIAQNTFRILGKLGGNNRRILNEPQQIQNEENNDNETKQNEIYLQMSFENESKSISVPLLKILRTCVEQLKSSLVDQQQIKRQAWLIIQSVLSILLSNDDEQDLVSHLLKHPSFLHGPISKCPTVWKSNVHIESRLGHDLLLKGLHQAAICKSIANEVLPLLKSTIQHYTLVAITQQTGPFSSENYIIENDLDCSMILIDSIIGCYIDIDEDLNSVGRISFETMINTLSTLFNNDFHRLTQLPLMHYLVERLLNHCHDPMWFEKQGACRFLSQLTLKTFSQQTDWLKKILPQIVENLIHVLISLTDEISSGTFEMISAMIKDLIQHYGEISKSDVQPNVLVELFVKSIFSPITSVRTLIYQSLRQLSQLYEETLSRLIEPFKKELIEKFSSSNLVPMKSQSLLYQITFLDVYIFFRSCEPKISYLTLFDDDLFKELTKLVLTDENELMKFSVYRCLTQQQSPLYLIELKKLALRTLGEYYDQLDYRERVLRLFYKMLTSLHSNELQTVVYESIEKMLNGHQNDQWRLRFVDSYIQQISFYDNEKFHCTLPVAQTLFFLSKLSPNSFDERSCEHIFNLIRKLLNIAVQAFRTNFDVQNQHYKVALIFLNLLANLTNSSKRIIESLTILIIKFDRVLMIESSCACRKHLIELLIRHPQLSLDQFIAGENRFQEAEWMRLFVDLLKHPASAMVQAFLRINWHDRFRQILSDQIVSIETSQVIQPIICLTIRSLSILAKTDPVWWSSQHELLSLILRLWRSNTFQQHSFVSSEHFDSFCSKELNNVLNLCLIYYQHHPTRVRLLLELTRIYACPEKLFYPKKFFHFIQDVLIKTYSLKWKCETLISFIALRTDESYTLECKSLFFEYILLPSFTYEFEHNRAEIKEENFHINGPEETIVDLFIRTMIDVKYLKQIHDKYRIALLRFLCLFLEYFPQLICEINSASSNKRDNEKLRRLMESAYPTLLQTNIDWTYKCQAHLLLCYIISRYSIVKKIIMHVFNSLLKSYSIDAKYLIRQATDLLIPAIPLRMDDGYENLATYTKKILSDDAHGNLQLVHIMSIIVRHQTIYFHVRYSLANLMIQSAQKLAVQQATSVEQRKLAVDIVEVLIRWELRKHHENIQDQRNFNRTVIDLIFVFLLRHACQINAPTMIPLSQQCIRLFKIARKFAWPQFDVKLTTFERLIHQIETQNPATHSSITTAIDLLAFLVSTFNQMQIKYTMRAMKRTLSLCVSVTNNPRLVEATQNLFSKLIAQIPIEPPAAILSTNQVLNVNQTTNPNATGLSQQLVQATLASLVTPGSLASSTMLNTAMNLSPAITNKNEDIEQFYAAITKAIIDNMNNSATSIVPNPTESARANLGSNANNVAAVTNSSMQTLPVAFGYLKIIEKHQPKYVDKLTPHITKLLQKLIKDHTSAGVDYNSAHTEYIIECLTLLKYRIGQLTNDLRKQFMNNFLPCLIEKSHDINLVRAIIRLVNDWLKWRGDVQLVPSLKEKSQLLLKLLQCIDKSGRFHSQTSGTATTTTTTATDADLTNSFLELILHVYQESNYRELSIKLEAAFVLGLKSNNQQLRKQFFLILDKNLRKNLHDRLLFIFLSQNWEYLGQHYWIKQCLELFYTCASSTTPLAMMDNRQAVLPALTSVVKSREFYDRYDFLIDYIKLKNPSAIESPTARVESNLDQSMKMDVNDESSTQTPAYSIISNALGVTAMSTLVTKKQRSTSMSANEPKVKHFKPSIAFENIRRLSNEKSLSVDMRSFENEMKLNDLITEEFNFLKTLATIQSKPMDLYDSILQFLHTNNSSSIDQLAHQLFIDLLPKILRIIPEKYRIILFQQVLQPFFVSGTHLQQRDIFPYSSLNTLLEAFASMFPTQELIAEFVPLIRPIVLKYIGKTHNTWHRSILLLENYIIEQSTVQEISNTDETYVEALNSLSELYEHLNEDDYNMSLWLQRKFSVNIQTSINNALQYEQMSLFPQALDAYTQSIKQLDREKSIPTTTSARFFQLDEYSFIEQHWIKCTKELNQWETLMSYCKQQSNRDHLLYLDCAWKSGNWPLMKETLGQLDAMCNGTNMNLTNSTLQTFQFLTQNPALTQSTIISNILTIKDFQWKLALYRCYLNLCSTVSSTEDQGIYQTAMNITERLIDYCSLNALKEWKHLPNYIANSHCNLLQASQRIIELQESAQILLNLQNNVNSTNSTSASIISTTTNGTTSTTTANPRPTSNMHELKTIVKTWKSRLPLINDPLSFWNDVFTWRELQYVAISSQYDKELSAANIPSIGQGNNSATNNTTSQVLLGIHAIAQSITQLGKIARKHQMPNVCMEILSRIGTVIPSVPVVDSYQKIKQVIKCYLILLPSLSSNEIQEIFDLIEQANTKYFNKDMMSEFYSLKGVAYSKLNRPEEAEKFFSCAAQLSDNNLPRIWISWADFLLRNSTTGETDESTMICYLNACRDLTEIKARSILSKVFYLLSRDHELVNSGKLSSCIERYLPSIPVQHWLFWLPQIMNKLLRNESSSCMMAILTEVIRVYPQAVCVQVKRARTKLIENKCHDENQTNSLQSTQLLETSLTPPTISHRQQALSNLKVLEQILMEQHSAVVRTLQILTEQMKTINETFFEYLIRRLYQCQRLIYQDLFNKRNQLSERIIEIFQHLRDLFDENDKMKTEFAQDFSDSELNNSQISRSFLVRINRWISLVEHRLEQTESPIRYLNPSKYLHLLSFHSQITNEINMPGELWHAPEANFYFRINKIFPSVERVFKHERFYHRLKIRAHNGKIVPYLLCNQYQTISSDDEFRLWEAEENTLQFLKMINNLCIRKEKELLKRHMQLYLPHLCTYLPSLRLIEDTRSTRNIIEIHNDRAMLAVRKYFQLLDDETNEETLKNIYQLIQNEFCSQRDLLHRWTWKEYSTATEYFSFRKIFTVSMSFYATLNYLFGFTMFTNNQLNIQCSIGNINPLYLTLDTENIENPRKIYLTPNVEQFINRFGKLGPFTGTILGTLMALARPKYHIVEFLKIFFKEDLHLKTKSNQMECVAMVERIAHHLETKFQEFVEFDQSKSIVNQLVENSTDINELSHLNPLLYPWL